jgi:hypothetical protein
MFIELKNRLEIKNALFITLFNNVYRSRSISKLLKKIDKMPYMVKNTRI